MEPLNNHFQKMINNDFYQQHGVSKIIVSVFILRPKTFKTIFSMCVFLDCFYFLIGKSWELSFKLLFN